jgi:hypothetical protein
MTMVLAWVLFPLVLALLSLGCGLAVERAASIELPGPLIIPVGFALIALVAQFAIVDSATAELATPAVVALAIAGAGLSHRLRRPRVDPWCLAAAVGTFAAFAAPVVLSGRATFAGYIKLDDTATYLAMLDRATQHGYDVAGLPPSTYEATLNTSLAYGYPLASVLPLGVGQRLVGADAAWLWQPYLTLLAMILALGLYEVSRGVLASPRLRALAAFIGAQAALLYGYALWGGVKELAVAAMVVLGAGLVPVVVRNLNRARAVLPLAVVSATIVGTLSVGGAGWLAPLLLAALVLGLRLHGIRGTLRASVSLLAMTALLVFPTLTVTSTWLSHSGAFTSGTDYANLRGRLSWLQIFGIWPAGDFRVPTAYLDETRVLVTVVGLGAALAVVLAIRRRAWEIPIAVATASFGAALYVAAGSPWVGGKALAAASPVILSTALVGAAAVFEGGRRVEGLLAAGVVAFGVVWSNALQYHDVFLAPSARLAELAAIGHRFAGRGPTLMTEFESYGARHFLRDMDAEAAAELRRRFVYLRSGGVAAFGVSPDIDEIQLPSVLDYRMLVLRRSGVGSRPPSTYSLVWSGRYYSAWRRAEGPSPILEHLSLGSRYQPAAIPACSEVERLARLAAANNGVLAAVERHPATVIEPDNTTGAPTSFGSYGEDPRTIHLRSPRSFELSFTTPAAGTYGIWAGGTWRSGLEASVDGQDIGSARNMLAWPGNFVELGTASLVPGEHRLRIEYDGPDFRPGSAGSPGFGLGPFAVSDATENSQVSYVSPAQSRSLCGKSLDWLEALRG